MLVGQDQAAHVDDKTGAMAGLAPNRHDAMLILLVQTRETVTRPCSGNGLWSGTSDAGVVIGKLARMIRVRPQHHIDTPRIGLAQVRNSIDRLKPVLARGQLK